LVEDVIFEVRTGEVLAIVGPSGSGKSSLLRLLNRLDEPTSGTVYVEGIDYRQIEPRELRRKLGLVNQRPYLFPGTVEDNLRFGPLQRGELLSQETIEQLLARVGLSGYASRNVANLSGGEAQRVSLAVLWQIRRWYYFWMSRPPRWTKHLSWRSKQRSSGSCATRD